jgi:hypothetical protein
VRGFEKEDEVKYGGKKEGDHSFLAKKFWKSLSQSSRYNQQ